MKSINLKYEDADGKGGIGVEKERVEKLKERILVHIEKVLNELDVESKKMYPDFKPEMKRLKVLRKIYKEI